MKNVMKNFWATSYIEYKAIENNKQIIYTQLMVPILYFVFFGFGIGNSFSSLAFKGESVSYIEYIFVGIIGVILNSQMNQSVYRVNLDKKWGLLAYKRIKGTSAISYFLGNGQSLLTMVTEMKKDGTSNLSKILAKRIEQELVRGESFSVALEKIGLFRKEFIWLVLEGEKTRQLDVQLKVYADQMLEDFSKGIEKKIKWIQPILLMGIGFLIVSMYLILLLPTLTMIGGN